MKNRIKRFIDRILSHCGYITKEEHKWQLKTAKNSYQVEIDRLESLNLDRLVSAIKTVNMMKVRFQSPKYSAYMMESVPVVEREEIYPPEPHWYRYQVQIDVSRVQRIYQDLEMWSNSPEFEYFKQSILHEIENNLDALMKVGI